MAMRIPLTNGGYALVSKRDFEAVMAKGPWYKAKNRHTEYARTTAKPHIEMHCFIMGSRPDKRVDHKNENGLDNRRKNLQHISHGDNIRKSSRNKGYHYCLKRDKWVVQVKVRGERFFKRVKTKKEAKGLAKLLKKDGIE